MRYVLLGLALVFALASVATGQPIAVMSIEPNPACVGQTVTLDGSQSVAVGQGRYLVLYEWDFDGDGEYDDATGVTQTLVYMFSGEYTVGLRVSDDIWQTGATLEILYITGASSTEPTVWGRIKSMYR